MESQNFHLIYCQLTQTSDHWFGYSEKEQNTQLSFSSPLSRPNFCPASSPPQPQALVSAPLTFAAGFSPPAFLGEVLGGAEGWGPVSSSVLISFSLPLFAACWFSSALCFSLWCESPMGCSPRGPSPPQPGMPMSAVPQGCPHPAVGHLQPTVSRSTPLPPWHFSSRVSKCFRPRWLLP